MKSINLKWKTLKKILCFLIIFINIHIIFDKLINISYVKSSKIDNYLIISNSNSNATRFEDLTYDSEVIWGNNITFSLNFTYTEDNGTTWNPVLDPNAYCNITISDLVFIKIFIKTNMTFLGNGIFFKAFNSSKLSAGGDKQFYRVTIEGSCPGYPGPISEIMLIRINAIPTKISAHNYSTLDELSDKTYTAYYNELINITIKYCINESGTPLNKAHLTYQWLSLAPIDIFVDPVNKEFYTFTINTSDAQNTGLYIIDITATYENYTTQSNFLIFLNIFERKTTLNNQIADFVYISTKILVQDHKDFIFTYRDNSTNEILSDLSTANYVWEELYENGTKVPGSFGSGNLTQNINKTYTLDFNTELRPVGYYFLYVNLKKDNYIQKNAFINLEIIPRPTLINGTTLTLAITKDIEFMTAHNFTFEINNTLTYSRIGDLDHAFYYWYRTDSNATILEGPSENIDLIKDINDLYILDFNTNLKSIGFYRIHVEFHKENYTSRYAVINLEIKPRTTLINGSTLNLTISKNIEFRTAHNFTFEINNTLTHSRIGDLDHAFYYWYGIDSNGLIFEGPSENIDLIKDLNDLYILDFNTNLKGIGFYRIHVEFHKENYTSRYAVINLEIKPRTTLINGSTLNLTISKNIEFRTAHNFTFEINNTLTHSRIGDLDHAFYYWYGIDSNGLIFEGPSENIDLIKDLNDLYILDFNTNLKGIGFYRIHVEFHKENYTSRYAIIYLLIYPPSENPSLKIFGYNLTILFGAISIITLAIKKKIFDQGLKKER
ncbi:MAG: hypothetical protein ACFE9X_11055 [Promethearchaeota archaeon]